MNITKHEIDSLNAEIKIAVAPADYEGKVNEAIKKVQRQASLPGFRPGKVPTGLIKKQYGTQILVDEMNKLLQDTIYKYIEENNLEILGNPLPKDQTPVDFEKQKEFDIARFDKNFAQLQSQTTTRILKSGVELGGTGLKILRANAEEAEVERNTITYNSQVAAAQRREAGNLYRIQGQFARQQGKAAAMTTLFKGATTFAGSSAGKSLLSNIPNPFANRDLTATEGSF